MAARSASAAGAACRRSRWVKPNGTKPRRMSVVELEIQLPELAGKLAGNRSKKTKTDRTKAQVE